MQSQLVDRSGPGKGLTTARPGRQLLLVAVELVVVGGLLLAYRWARLLVGHSSDVAFDNARALLDWERALPLPDELAVQQLLLTSEPIVRLANLYYVAVHFPLTAAFLVWLFVRSRPHYYRIRTSLALLTGLALAIHAAFPLAPARMLSDRGFVDTGAIYGPTVYSSPDTDTLTNQFAAMPSLHFGWAVMVALGAIRVSRSRYRVLWVAHPITTLLVIVGTANHYWLDAAVAGGLILLAEYVVGRWRSRRRRPVLALDTVADWPEISLAPTPAARDHPTPHHVRTRALPHPSRHVQPYESTLRRGTGNARTCCRSDRTRRSAAGSAAGRPRSPGDCYEPKCR